ncbi:MAG TPA: hypothetical protein VN381_05745 [Anaerovoracaceae bacterium]|nr:hypothetical protein [Anaerovoracaceae bacterium]
MKVFIVFMGLLIINVSFLSYQGDLGRYVRCQAFLKATAEECAAGAALYYDEAAYSDGQFRFNYAEGQEFIKYFLAESKEEMPLPRDSAIAFEVTFRDDYLGYEGGDESEGGSGDEDGAGQDGGNIPSVTVELTAVTGDLFRLPFLEVTEITRAAKYELPQ